MCIANVIVPKGKIDILKDGEEEEFLDKISKVKVEDNGLTLEHYYQGKKTIEAEIKEIDFVNSELVLERK